MAELTREQVLEAVRAGKPSTLAVPSRPEEPFDARDVARAAAAGDELAGRVWDETCRYLALACVNLQHLLNPQKVVLAGGLSGAGGQLLRPVRAHVEQLTWKLAPDTPAIELAALGNDAGMIGAAALARTATAS